jgi:hypothetical protein
MLTKSIAKRAEEFMTSTASHESDCGHASHPAGCRCSTYDLPTPVTANEMTDIFTELIGQENF